MRFHALTAGFFPIHVLGQMVRFDESKTALAARPANSKSSDRRL
jgi:hypothetical protein